MDDLTYHALEQPDLGAKDGVGDPPMTSEP